MTTSTITSDDDGAEATAAIASAPVLPDAVRERVESAIADSLSSSTRRAYATAWAAWAAWADMHGAAAMPAEPAAVATYLAHRAEGGARMGTLRMATAAIAAAHRREGEVNPCADRAVRVVMGGLARQAVGAGHAVRQVRGLTAEAVAAIRGALNGRVDTHWRTARDMAIVSVMSDAGLRRSEAAALTWTDVAREDDGSGRITVRRSKTDQLAAGAVVAITPQALADLDRFAALRPPASESARVFGVSDGQIARRIAAAAAGLDGDYRGHSGRVGMAQRMTRNGAPVAAVMRQGCWQSVRMVASYTRNEAAGEALRYL